MSPSKYHSCRDCRYCKLTVKANHISFRCFKHSWPCTRDLMECDDFRCYIGSLGNEVINFAWELTEDEG